MLCHCFLVHLGLVSTWHSEKGTSVPERGLDSALDLCNAWGMDLWIWGQGGG